MVYDKAIIGQHIILRSVEQTDCNENYYRWMNDVDTNRYMETRWKQQSRESIVAFVSEMRASTHSYLFAMIESSSGRHIGNIKLGPINERYGYADISYFIGEDDCRGKGYAREAIELVCTFAFQKLGLHRIQAGVISGNYRSVKALEACGFRLEGCQIDKFVLDGKFANHLLFGRINGSESS